MTSDLLKVVSVRTISTLPERAQISLRVLTQKDRTLLALKSLGMFWGIAALSILIPVLHFFLVPTFFLLGPIVAYMSYQKTVKILGGTVACPNCKKQISLEPATSKWPHEEICLSCRMKVIFSYVQ